MALNPKLLIATNNPGKLKELTGLLAEIPYRPVSLADVRIDTEVAETGSTLEENARLKATRYSQMSGLLTLADDSGLEVAALNGEPGVLSSRYAGEGAGDSQKIAYLLDKLDNIPEGERSARFRCVLALAIPQGKSRLYTGECEGRILECPRGENGFGYDPVFLLEGRGKTMAELTQTEKNEISHRSKAARKVVQALTPGAEWQHLH